MRDTGILTAYNFANVMPNEEDELSPLNKKHKDINLPYLVPDPQAQILTGSQVSKRNCASDDRLAEKRRFTIVLS